MLGDRNKEVTRLLKRGLNHYGLGDLEAAIECWERARAVDPENHAVHDYLESAYQEREGEMEEFTDDDLTPLSAAPSPPESPPEPIPEPLPAPSASAETETISDPDKLIEAALAAYKAGKLERAWKALQRVSKADPERLDVQGYLQLVGNARVEEWVKEIGDQGRMLRLACTTEEMMKLKLHTDEGFLLSQIDGKVTIADLISLSTCGRERTLEVVARLLREKIVA